MSRFFTLPLTLLAFCSMFSCAPTYFPNTANVPLLSVPGEVNLDLNLGTSGIELQSAAAITDHFAAMLNMQALSVGGGNDGEIPTVYGIFEVAGGYYRPIGQNWRFETFGGIGLGGGQTTEPLENSDHISRFGFDPVYDVLNNENGEPYERITYRAVRYFIQANFGFTSAVFDGAIAAKLASVQLSNIILAGELIPNSIGANFFEPTVTLRVGGGPFKVGMQVGGALLLAEEPWVMDYNPVVINILLNIRLSKGFKQIFRE